MSEDSTDPAPRLRQQLKDFAGYTTLHGLHFVFERHGQARRVIWLILFLTGFGICARQLVISYWKLTAHEHVISKAIILSDELTFPAVTLCNANMMKKSKIQGTDAQLYLDQLNVLKQLYLSKDSANKTLNSSFDIEEAVLKYGHTAKDMIQTCTWNGEFCSHTNVSTFFSQLYGLCHTFNPGKHGHPLLTSTSIKKSNGLILYLNIGYLEYYGINSYFSTGIKLVAHDQNEVPMVELYGMSIVPGQTVLTLRRNEYNHLPPPFESACDSRKLETSNVYTKSVCLQECQTRRIVKKCGCKLLGMPDLKEFHGTKNCDPSAILSCGLRLNVSPYKNISQDGLLTKYFLAMEGLFSSNNPEKDCDCPRPCKEVKYEIVQKNSVAMLSDSFWNDTYEMNANNLLTEAEKDALKSYTVEKKKMFGLDYIVMMVHFEGLHTHNTIEREAYDFNDFGSDVGGFLGLFLGCSILTVFEILDFLLFLCYTQKKAKKQVNLGFLK